jgi:hypothetical protein
MMSNRGIQPNAANDNVRVSSSLRDPGALSGTLAGVSFIGGVAVAGFTGAAGGSAGAGSARPAVVVHTEQNPTM